MGQISDKKDDGHLPQRLIKLGTFEWPRSEVRQTLGHLYEKFKTGLVRDVTEDAVDTGDLKVFSGDKFALKVREILASTLQGQLDQTYLEWTHAANTSVRHRAFVYPPMKETPLADWANRHGMTVIGKGDDLNKIAAARCIVIPNLDLYFSRDHNRLADLFDLFQSLSGFEGKVIIGCNSWAWQYLRQFDDAHLLFDDAYTIPAFDADALSALLALGLAQSGGIQQIKSVASGDLIQARDEDGSLVDPYLEALSGLSLGLPWVAVELFFDGISERNDESADQSHDNVWALLPESTTLPTDSSDALLFALHALLIHGPRTIEDLTKFLPHRAPNGLWSELERKGFVEIHNGIVSCAIKSYPAIRNELGAAGFNLDEL